MSMKKCRLFMERIDYFRFEIDARRLEALFSCQECNNQLEQQMKTNELKSFLSSGNNYRRFAPHFASINSHSIIGWKGDPKTFDHLPTDAALKQDPKAASVLALSSKEDYRTLDIDACSKQTGCMLMQDWSDGVKRLMRYWSRMLIAARQKLN